MIAQDCQDTLLLEVSAKDDMKDSMLSFVHIVKNDDEKDRQVRNQAGSNSDMEFKYEEDSDYEINKQEQDYESRSSDEEFEFE